MRRWIVLGGVIAVGTVSLAIASQQSQPPAAKVLEAEKLRDNLYVLTGTGSGGATAAFITAKGVVVVDTKNPGWGQVLLDKIKTFTDKPVITIINTHTHADHVGGNPEFPANIDIVAQENTKSNMERMAPVTGIAPSQQPPANIFKGSNGRGMPTRTFKDKTSLMSGSDRIDLYYFGRGHTNGDAFVVFPALHVMHAGDMFSGKNPPLLDANNGGSGVAIADSLAKAAQIKNVDAIITGHSKTMTWAELQEYVQFNRDFLADVKAAMKAGKTPEAAAEEWKVPAKYQDYTAPPARVKANFQVIYDELKK